MKFQVLVLALGCLPALPAAESQFYSPIRNNDVARVRELIRQPGPRIRDTRGNSPLMYAAALGTLDVLQALVDAGGEVNAANDFGATPLMWCAGDAAKVRYLLSKGADVNARAKSGRTPLLIAAAYDGATEAARLLIDKGADVNARDEGGMSVLASAANVNNIAVARMLLAKGARVDVRDALGITALLLAAWNGDRNAEMVKLLLEHHADPNVPSGDSFEIVKNGPLALGKLTPLQVAAAMGNAETIEALIKAGADIHAKDVRGATPLVFAVATDHANPQVVKLLLDKGADPKPALDWARKYRHPGVMRLFHLAPQPVTEPSLAETRRGVRESLEKALAITQPSAKGFLATGGCLSCHSQHFGGLAVSAGRAAGIPADYALESSEAKTTALLRGGLEQALFQVQDPPAGVDSQQLSLMQMSASTVAPSLATDSLLHHIAAMQRKEGDWPNYGVARPPLEDGGFSHTAMGIRSLTLYPIAGRKAEFDERIARAASWLEKAEPVSTEDRTMQILGIAWARRPVPRDRVRQLTELQRANGGWGQTGNLPADAYATGEALWALHEAGMPATDPAYRRGVDYLLRTQQPDGSWHVVTRALGFQPYFESGFPHGHDQWISQSGTAMAAIALSFAVTK